MTECNRTIRLAGEAPGSSGGVLTSGGGAALTSGGLVKPEPREAVSIREAMADDLEFIDSLQKMHTRMVGWMPTSQLENYIEKGNVLVAEKGGNAETQKRKNAEAGEGAGDNRPHPNPLPGGEGAGTSGGPLGYCIARDQYFKRDDVGILYQVNVLPGSQRGLIGASLVKSVFERAAYGCRLFCLWCAQDLEANHFWESLGFVPLAFRTGSRGKKRVHIFWQRRVREADTATPYWFPSQTSGGAIREDRLVIPIPPGTHWSDAKPLVLPGGPGMDADAKALEGEQEKRPRSRRKKKKKVIAKRSRSIVTGGLRFAPPEVSPAEAVEEVQEQKEKKASRKPGGSGGARPHKKNDPRYVAAARELRDRFLEQINAPGAPGSGDFLLPETRSKYDVSRALAAGSTMQQINQIPMLDAA